MKNPMAIFLCCALLLTCAMPVAMAEEEPVTVSWLHQSFDVSSLDHWYDALWVKELESRMNVKFDFISVNSTDNYDNVVNLTIASGAYPDIISWDWSKYSGGIEAAIEDGLAIPFTQEGYVELVPNYINLINGNDAIRRAMLLSDGSMATFCHVEEDTKRQAYSGYAIRKDWLDRLGLAVPTTIDGLHTALCAFRDQDANGNGDPGDELPMSDRSTLNLMKELAAAWGLMYNTMQLDPATGEVTHWTQVNGGQNFRDFALTMHQWYAEGLIDPEFVTNTQTEINSKVTSDRLGFYHTNTNRYPGYEVLLRQTVQGYADPDGIALQPLARFLYQYDQGEGKHYTAASNLKNWVASQEGNVITSAALKGGKVEKILELFNYMYSEEGTILISWGVEGVSFSYDEAGNKAWTPEVLNQDGSLSSDMVMRYCLPTRGEFPKIMDLKAWMSIDCIGDEAKQGLAYNFGADKDLIIPNILLVSEDAETYTRIMTDVNTATAEAFLSVVVGNKDASAIDELLKTIDQMGVKTAIEIYAGVYDAYMNK